MGTGRSQRRLRDSQEQLRWFQGTQRHFRRSKGSSSGFQGFTSVETTNNREASFFIIRRHCLISLSAQCLSSTQSRYKPIFNFPSSFFTYPQSKNHGPENLRGMPRGVPGDLRGYQEVSEAFKGCQWRLRVLKGFQGISGGLQGISGAFQRSLGACQMVSEAIRRRFRGVSGALEAIHEPRRPNCGHFRSKRLNNYHKANFRPNVFQPNIQMSFKM